VLIFASYFCYMIETDYFFPLNSAYRYYVKEGGVHDQEKKDRMTISFHPWIQPFSNLNNVNIDYIQQYV